MQAVIVAAGESKRFWPLSTKQKNKSQVFLFGKPLIYWTIKGLAENGVKDIIVVRNPHSSLQETLDRENDLNVHISYVVQEKQLGTGNALWQAKDLIKEPFFVIWPYRVDSGKLVAQMNERIKKLSEEMPQTNDPLHVSGVSSTDTTTPWEYGIIEFDEKDQIVQIVENPKEGEEPSRVKASAPYFLHPDFFSYYEKTSHHEADFIEALNSYYKDKKVFDVRLERDLTTLKYPWHLFGVMEAMFESEYFKEGRGENVQIGKNVVIENEEQVYIGDNTRIGANTVIEGPVYIGDNCKIGYSNVLREPLNIESGFISGAFMEIKHSIIQKNSHFHSGFVGDSIIGENCRFGAGFITANRRLDRGNIKVKVNDEKIDTDLTHLGTAIGDSAKLGIHTGTMPGIFIGSDCVVGPGTMVMEHLADGATFYNRFQNETKQDETS